MIFCHGIPFLNFQHCIDEHRSNDALARLTSVEVRNIGSGTQVVILLASFQWSELWFFKDTNPKSHCVAYTR